MNHFVFIEQSPVHQIRRGIVFRARWQQEKASVDMKFLKMYFLTPVGLSAWYQISYLIIRGCQTNKLKVSLLKAVLKFKVVKTRAHPGKQVTRNVVAGIGAVCVSLLLCQLYQKCSVLPVTPIYIYVSAKIKCCHRFSNSIIVIFRKKNN